MRRRLVMLGALVALVGAPALTVLVWPGPAPVTSTPTLPAEFAAFSHFTAHAEQRPAGRAIAVYETGMWAFGGRDYQVLAVGADRDSYRMLNDGPADGCAHRPPILLSPDGGHVLRQAAGAATDQFELLDLTTGQSSLRRGVAWTPLPDTGFRDGEVLDLLAWSPDGRYVAYAVHVRPCLGTYEGSLSQAGPHPQLAILDLVADRAVLTDVQDVVNAAFAPDSARLAVALPTNGIVVSVDGTRLHPWMERTGPRPETGGSAQRIHLPGSLGMAWSPDGALLAVSSTSYCGQRVGFSGPQMTVTAFVDMATGRPASPQPGQPCLAPLGWRSPTVLVGEQIRDGRYGLAEASLEDGSTTPLSRFSDAIRCEFLRKCDVGRIQLATNLLADTAVRKGIYADRGPTVAIVHLGPFMLLLLAVGLVTWRVVRGLRHRRQPPPSVSPPPKIAAAGPAPSGG